jgi:hypothetical protein
MYFFSPIPYIIDTSLLHRPMSKFKHDSFAKSYLAELLNRIGKATPNKRIPAEERAADLWFELNPKAQTQRKQLGLLGELLTRNALIEVFRNAATPVEIRSCQGKLFDREAELIRKAKRRQKTIAEAQLPYLWLIMPTASDEIREGFGVVPTRTPGVYEFPRLQHTGLIVVHQLPKTKATLWLRILGREGNQKRAIEEFTQQSSADELHVIIEELLANYRAQLENLGRSLTPEDEELIMNLSAAYLKKQQEWLTEGRQEERREIAIAALREGYSPESISTLTGLSLEAIEKLRVNLSGK